MKTLTLSIKQTFFDEIKSGNKKEEVREIRANTSGKYIEYQVNGEKMKIKEVPADATDVECVPIKYDQIRFLTGEYKGKRPSMLVEVLGEDIIILTDEQGDDIVYEYEGFEYVAAEIRYKLGKVID
ncbi:MAG: ASCH domain-containing protein [Bacteroidetes bacterium HGW-Bacteroidetes-8]|jgi:hypothetical protein|nr:MAG: ASCH domain-containing protein [Bacteroidetes bacterium HGW-Bacteroidetes-8]